MYEMDSNKKMALNLKLAMYIKVEKFDAEDYAVLAVYPACFYGASKEHPYEVCLARFETEEPAQAYLEDLFVVANY